MLIKMPLNFPTTHFRLGQFVVDEKSSVIGILDSLELKTCKIMIANGITISTNPRNLRHATAEEVKEAGLEGVGGEIVG